MNELKLTKIAPYLPYGLRAINCFNEVVEIKGLQIGDDSVNNELWIFNKNGEYLKGYLYQCKPILRPLSDLTREIEYNGEGFIPIERIDQIEGHIVGINRNGLCFHTTHENFFNQIEGEEVYKTYQKLYEWHFDVHNLIERGLAVDYNTVNQNV